ncbi:hypothetical protein [Paraburkholderia sp.]|uniref:hypothetical protein n=1 Tax=Paraburkholderia sp. TaxID=1926495 RepID=UPI003D6F0E47
MAIVTIKNQQSGQFIGVENNEPHFVNAPFQWDIRGATAEQITQGTFEPSVISSLEGLYWAALPGRTGVPLLLTMEESYASRFSPGGPVTADGYPLYVAGARPPSFVCVNDADSMVMLGDDELTWAIKLSQG